MFFKKLFAKFIRKNTKITTTITNKSLGLEKKEVFCI